jgi:hypothetical protein
MLAVMLMMYLVVVAFLALPVVQTMTGQDLSAGLAKNGLGTVVILIVGPWLLFLGSIPILIMAPDVHVSGNRFRISALFYTSPWLEWDEISAIKQHWMSSRWGKSLGVVVEGISPFYEIIGLVQLLESRGFIIFDSIQHYSELVQLMQSHRPDLFE